MALSVRLSSVLRSSGRALCTTVGRQQRRALVGDSEDPEQEQVTRKNFADIQREREQQARHSVLISYSSKLKQKTILRHLKEHGDIAHHFFFTSTGGHALVEFVKTESIHSLLSATRIPDEDVHILPIKTRLIQIGGNVEAIPPFSGTPKALISLSHLLDLLSDAKSIADQAHILVEKCQLTEESIRLRYLVSSLVCDIATAYFPEASVELYGSSVNTFGKIDCDLDLFLNLNTIKDSRTDANGSLTIEYIMKRASSDREAQQKILSFIAESIDCFGPGCTNVRRILNARCPLVRFQHLPSDLQCDLTTGNRFSLKSSELLYIYGTIDSRVRPLVFFLRYWAYVHGITKSMSGHWITNFSLTSLVLFFLQKRNPPVIPTLDQLKNLADLEDTCIIEGKDCTFLGDLSKIEPSANTEPLEKLLLEFLAFYGSFDFSSNSIDIRKGIVKNKPEAFPLYIQNPFEQSLNISKNVNMSQLERFVQLVQKSCWILENDHHPPSQKKVWGLASVLHKSVSDGAFNSKPTLAREKLNGILDSLKNGKRT